VRGVPDSGLVHRCVFCGDEIPADEFDDEAALEHLMRRHMAMLVALSSGSFRAVEKAAGR
jgi:hypothetical protein